MVELTIVVVVFVIFVVVSLISVLIQVHTKYRIQQHKWRIAFRRSFGWIGDFISNVILFW